MKKSLIVLLIAVLAMGSVFAADPVVSGSASASATWDFDAKTFEYSKGISGTAYINWLQQIDLANKGEGNVYIDAAGNLKYVPVTTGLAYKSTYFDSYQKSGAASFKFTLTKLAIVAENWTLDLYAKTTNSDFATDVIDKGQGALSYENRSFARMPWSYQWSTLNASWASARTVSFAYNGIGKIYVMALANGGDEDSTTNTNNVADSGSFSVKLESEEKTFDELTAQAVVAYSYEQVEDEKTSKFGASVKAAYSDVLTVASDMGFVKEGKEDAVFNADIALHAAYEPVTFDAYYATEAFGVNTLLTTPAQIKDAASEVITKEDLLSFKAVADVEDVNTVATFTATNVIDKVARRIGVKLVNTSLDKHEFTLALSDLSHKVAYDEEDGFSGIGIDFTAEVAVNENTTAYAEIANLLGSASTGETPKPVVSFGFAYDDDVYAVALDASVDTNAKTYDAEADFADYVDFAFTASYKAEKFTASAAAYLDMCPLYVYNTHYGFDTNTGAYYTKYTSSGYTYKYDDGLRLNLNLTSDVIVNGATIALDWTTGRLNYKSFDLEKAELGALTASCTVYF